jgi:hypothetical protein
MHHYEKLSWILIFFSVLSLLIRLLPSICLLAYDALISHPVSTVSPQAAKSIQELAQVLTDFPWDELSASEKTVDLKPVIAKFKQVEQTVGRVVSLLRKVLDSSCIFLTKKS